MTIQEEEKQELTIVEEDDDDDGPPPGFQCIITPPEEKAEADDDDDDDDDGPPPGFCSIAPEPYDTPRISEQDNIDYDDKNDDDDDDDDKNDDDGDDGDEDDEDEDEDDDDGPPPGWEFSSLVDALPIATSCTADIKEEDNESDDGPPPGWELPCQMPPPHTPSLQPPSIVSSGTEIERRQTTSGNVEEVPPSESQQMAMPMPGQSSPATPPLKQPPSSELPSGDHVSCCLLDAGNKDCNQKYGENKPTFWHKPASLPKQLPPIQAAISSSSEKCQLVCGTCRKLCLYPRGAKWVQCPGCQEVNFVLEAHEVGQVKCGGCSVLLMYLHGAPAVECSSCRFVTQIGLQNRRAPLSVQQAQARAQAQAQRRLRRAC